MKFRAIYIHQKIFGEVKILITFTLNHINLVCGCEVKVSQSFS